jgi:hypothetical protein
MQQLFIQFINYVWYILHVSTLHFHPQGERSKCLLRDAQLRSSQKALGTLPEDGNIMSKHVGDTIHN